MYQKIFQCLLHRYKGKVEFLDAASLPEFLQELGSLEEAECIFEHLIEEAKKFSSVESLLLYFISEEYLAKDDYLLNRTKSEWFLEFELLTLVSSQKSVLEHWSQNWGLHLADHDWKRLNEIYHISEMKTGVLISKESFPHLFDWYAKHVFSLPVHNALAERQFNITDLYLDPNMSEETNQATQLFVQNIIHERVDKANKSRTTAKTRDEYRSRMVSYSNTITAELINQAKVNIHDQKQGTAEHPAPLKAKDVVKEKWKGLKERPGTQQTLGQLESEGRDLEIRWQSTTLKNKYLEAERTFKPSFSEDIWAKDHVPSLRIICASQIRAFGDVLKIDDLPYDCQILIRYLPKIVEAKDVPCDPALSVNQIKTTNDGPNKDNRILPSWMLQRQLIEDDQDGLPAAEVKGLTITN